MRFWFAVVISLLLALPSAAQTDQELFYGRFDRQPAVVFAKDGTTVKLAESLKYFSPDGSVWEAPAGTVTDGASIPRMAWPIVGPPLGGKYLLAAIIHDVGCVKKDKPWELVHLTFYYGMLAQGMSERHAKIMYLAVYHFGPKWGPATRPHPKVVDTCGSGKSCGTSKAGAKRDNKVAEADTKAGKTIIRAETREEKKVPVEARYDKAAMAVKTSKDSDGLGPHSKWQVLEFDLPLSRKATTDAARFAKMVSLIEQSENAGINVTLKQIEQMDP